MCGPVPLPALLPLGEGTDPAHRPQDAGRGCVRAGCCRRLPAPIKFSVPPKLPGLISKLRCGGTVTIPVALTPLWPARGGAVLTPVLSPHPHEDAAVASQGAPHAGAGKLRQEEGGPPSPPCRTASSPMQGNNTPQTCSKGKVYLTAKHGMGTAMAPWSGQHWGQGDSACDTEVRWAPQHQDMGGQHRPARRGDKCPFLQWVLWSSKHIQSTQPGALGCVQSPGTGVRAHRAQPLVWFHRDGHRALDTTRAQCRLQGCHLPEGLSSREEDHPIPTSMGTGQAATGLGKEERKIPARDLGKKLPKEGLEEVGVEAPSQGAWGTGRAGDASVAPGWGAATNS